MIRAGVVATLIAALGSPASAYVRSTTLSGDHELYWLETEVVYHLDLAGSDNLTEDDSEMHAVRASFESWASAQCGAEPFRMSFLEGSFLSSARVEYVEGGENANVLKWVEDRESWMHSLAVIGVTSATYDSRDGRILDTDIEFNGVKFNYTTTGSPVDIRTDVQNTATHEIGHLLGLDHTPVVGATMEARAPEGETRKRTLAEDDVAGVCAVFPPEDLGRDEPSAEGWVCGRVAPGPDAGPRPGDGLLGACLLGGLMALRRRTRAGRRSGGPSSP